MVRMVPVRMVRMVRMVPVRMVRSGPGPHGPHGPGPKASSAVLGGAPGRQVLHSTPTTRKYETYETMLYFRIYARGPKAVYKYVVIVTFFEKDVK
jgi:hypothetical protein